MIRAMSLVSPMLTRRARASIAALLVLGIAACGGGGGSDSNTVSSNIAVSFSPSSVVSTFPEKGEGLNPAEAIVTATVTNLPSSQVYPFVIDPSGVLYPSQLTVYQTDAATFTATLPFNPLAAGTYSGTFSLELCPDSQCSSHYAISGGTLPYTLTVTPGINLTAQVNGVATTLTAAGAPIQSGVLALDIKSGDAVTIQSSLPVQWGEAEGGAYASNVVTTTTTWSGSISAGPGPTGLFQLRVITIGSPQATLQINIGAS